MKEKPVLVFTHTIHQEVMRRELKGKAKVILAQNPSTLKKALRHADGLITLLSMQVTKELLADAPQLKVIGNFAVGINNIDLEACRQRGIRVVNTPKVLTRATAELALTLLLACARRVPEGESLCRQGNFKGWGPDLLLGLELEERSAVLVGEGRIGKETGRLFRGIGLKTQFITRHDTPNQITAKLRQAQVLSFHMPLTPQTHHWLNAKRITLLPKDAIVINTARGPVIDEKALISALKQKRIFAAGFDVYEEEPSIPSELRKLPNAVLLPHLGSATQKARKEMAELVIRGTLAILNDKKPWNEVPLC